MKAEYNEKPVSSELKLKFISGKNIGSKLMSIISVAGHQVVKNLSRQSEITLVQLDFYTNYLREAS